MTEAVVARHSSRGLVGLLCAQTLALTGTRMTMVVLPWFALTLTGSAAATGVVAFCEMAPYLIVKFLAGPLLDRVGSRRTNIVADAASFIAVGSIPLLNATGHLRFSLLLVLVAVAGAARGPGDAAKSTLVPDVAAAAGTPLERATGLSGTIDRLGQTAGPFLGGFLTAWLGTLSALGFTAIAFAVSGAVVALTAPRHRVAAEGSAGPVEEDEQGYRHELRSGVRVLWTDPLLRAITGMAGVTNMIDAAVFAIVLPVWARSTGAGPTAIGLVVAAAGGGAVVGSIVATVLAGRLPRRRTYLLAFLIGGAPRIAVLAFHVPVPAIVAIWGASGLALGLINPILSATIYERIPPRMLGRTWALTSTVSFVGVPVGGLLLGGSVAFVGANATIIAAAVAYFLATMLPAFRPEWRQMDRAGAPGDADPPEVGEQAASGPVGAGEPTPNTEPGRAGSARH
ncbi:MAG: hypothetical protein QG671_4345 [Actinomycetota bacterium]|nr:hypothetical protein [Actinomycetota bacterium]